MKTSITSTSDIRLAVRWLATIANPEIDGLHIVTADHPLANVHPARPDAIDLSDWPRSAGLSSFRLWFDADGSVQLSYQQRVDLPRGWLFRVVRVDVFDSPPAPRAPAPTGASA